MVRWIVVLSVMLSLVGCGRIQNERFTGGAETLPEGMALTATVENGESLAVGTPAQVLITLTRDGAPLSGAQLTVEGNMTHAGMTPVLVTAVEAAPGEYRAPIEWTMGGDWFLTVQGTLPDGSTFERRLEEQLFVAS